ncbi:uncharacterized protein METZ01_LOCUS452364, partial [marine metagenome]
VMKEALSEIFVTVGFHVDFSRLVCKMDELATRLETKVVMQIGSSSYQPKNSEFFRFAPSIEKYIKKADLVVSHAGVGSILEVLKAEKPLVVVPRQAQYDEHIDDHQVEFSETFADHSAVEVVHDVGILEEVIQQITEKFNFVKFDDSNRIRLVRALRKFVQISTK